MTTYKVTGKTAYKGLATAPEPCCSPPPCCSRYPLPISLPNDLVDPNCQPPASNCCDGTTSFCLPWSYWGLPYWWPP